MGCLNKEKIMCASSNGQRDRVQRHERPENVRNVQWTSRHPSKFKYIYIHRYTYMYKGI